MVADYLIDNKKELNRLDGLYNKHSKGNDFSTRERSKERCIEIKEERQIVYERGLNALSRYATEVPQCVRDYYLKSRPEPTIDEIMNQLQKIHHAHRPVSKRAIYIVMISLVIIFTILAILL